MQEEKTDTPGAPGGSASSSPLPSSPGATPSDLSAAPSDPDATPSGLSAPPSGLDAAPGTPDASDNSAVPAAPGFWAERKAGLLALFRYPCLIDFRAAGYSIFFMITASWFFKRIPDFPLAILIAIPFAYLSVLGVVLLLAGSTLEHIFSDSRFGFLRKLFAENGVITGFCRRDGEKFLHSAFATGCILLLAAAYYAVSSSLNWVWFLMPLIFMTMLAQYSLNQYLVQPKKMYNRKELRTVILRRGVFALLFGLSLWGGYMILAAIGRLFVAAPIV